MNCDDIFVNHGGGSLTSADYYGVYVFMEKIKQGGDRVDIAGLEPGVSSEPEISGGYIWKKDKDDPDDQNFTAAGKMLTAVYPRDMPANQLTWLTDHVNQVVGPAGHFDGGPVSLGITVRAIG